MAGRGRYTVSASQVDSIVTHRSDPKDARKSQYLLRWRSSDPLYPPLSWHGLDELSAILHLVQQDVTRHKEVLKAGPSTGTIHSKKRKLSGNHGHQLPTPRSGLSPSSGMESESGLSTLEERSTAAAFNGHLQFMQGEITVVPSANAARLNVHSLPTKAMREAALRTDILDAELAVHNRYVSRLRKLPGPTVQYHNEVDRETPSLAFKFLSSYLFRPGVTKRDDLMMGCQKCRPNMGANRGCEYTKKCDCLEFAAPDLDKMDEIQRADYQTRLTAGEPSMDDLPKRFPYYNTGPRANCLVDFYLSERHPIYECNAGCLCGPRCKNRNVQHGRRVPLDIFRTPDARGFGLRCLETLRRGQFIDVYLGEVITDTEATAREASQQGKDKASYLFSLDKFAGESEITDEDCFVVDGEFFGGPTRFMNHSCAPNVQMHTVSYNKYDLFVYDLAFFACEDIPAGQELTFDYMDADDGEDSKLEEDREGPERKKVPCLCGAERCRGFLWT